VLFVEMSVLAVEAGHRVLADVAGIAKV